MFYLPGYLFPKQLGSRIASAPVEDGFEGRGLHVVGRSLAAYMIHHALVRGPASIFAKDPALADQRRQKLSRSLNNTNMWSLTVGFGSACTYLLYDMRLWSRIGKNRSWPIRVAFASFSLVTGVLASVAVSLMYEPFGFSVLSRQLAELDAEHDDVCPLSALYRATLRQVYMSDRNTTLAENNVSSSRAALNRFLCPLTRPVDLDIADSERDCDFSELPFMISLAGLPGLKALSRERWPRQLSSSTAWCEAMLASQRIASGELQVPGMTQQQLADFKAKAPLLRQLHMATVLRRVPRSRRSSIRRDAGVVAGAVLPNLHLNL
ncbi:MAG: hypothetical protein MHM6MM_001325 [Cercozoa sp. M6MM]